MIEAALCGLVAVDCRFLRKRPFPWLYQSGVRYRREGRGGVERWLTIPELLKKRFGDCEDLAAWRTAELIVRKGVPARIRVIRTGRKTMHAVVELPDGSIEDPSRRLGMKGRG